jgi:di/tricarboxylate transporter
VLDNETHWGCAIDSAEADFIWKKDDLIPVSPKDRSWFRSVLEKSALLRTAWFGRFLQREPQDIETIGDGQTIWHNEKRVERFSSAVIAIVGLVMLIGPLWILEHLVDLPKKLGVITGFIVLFFVLVGVATAAKVFEALAAAAAYSAVLMVFLQFGSH